MKHIVTWMATAATLTFALPADCSQKDPRLDPLFRELKLALHTEAARTIENRIWGIWLESDDDAVNLYMAEGLRAMSAREHDAALKAFNEVVRRLPDFAEGWNKRATVEYLLGDFEASVADIERTLALEPRHFGALSGLGLISLALGREKQALEAFEAALRIYPLMPGADSHIRELRERIEGKRI